MATEELRFSVLDRDKDFELRDYAPHIAAETLVQGDFEGVGNEGFRRLFEYISGRNRADKPIPADPQLTQAPTGEKIPMTAPVNQQKEGSQWRISFVMPSRYSLETLPEPLDARIVLKKVPGQLIAAVKYSGTWSRERYESKKAQLESWIRTKGYRPSAEAVFARYNSPFTPWFMRRNEVLIPVERAGAESL